MDVFNLEIEFFWKLLIFFQMYVLFILLYCIAKILKLLIISLYYLKCYQGKFNYTFLHTFIIFILSIIIIIAAFIIIQMSLSPVL